MDVANPLLCTVHANPYEALIRDHGAINLHTELPLPLYGVDGNHVPHGDVNCTGTTHPQDGNVLNTSRGDRRHLLLDQRCRLPTHQHNAGCSRRTEESFSQTSENFLQNIFFLLG